MLNGREENNNGNGNTPIKWKAIGGVSAGSITAVILAFSINTAKDAQIALSIVEQHGHDLIELRAELKIMRDDIRERTKLRYTSVDATKDYNYFNQRLLRFERLYDTRTQ